MKKRRFWWGSEALFAVLGEARISKEAPLLEWRELRHEIKARNWGEARKEWNDVCGVTALWLACYAQLDVPIFPMFGKSAVDRWVERNEVWKIIFKSQNVKFDRKYLHLGSNYGRQHKVETALNNAGIPSEDIDWLTAAVRLYQNHPEIKAEAPWTVELIDYFENKDGYRNK